MLSLLIGLIVCGVSLMRGTDTYIALDYSLDVTWWTYLVTVLLLFFLGILVLICGVATDTDKLAGAGGTIVTGSIISGSIGLFGLTLLCNAVTPTPVTNTPLLVVGVLLLAYSAYCDRNIGKSLTSKDKE